VAGEDLLPLAQFGAVLGWRVDVVASRVTVEAQRRWAPVLDAPIRPGIEIEALVTSSTPVLVATHNYLDDLAILRGLIPTATPYIGILGSRDRVARLLEDASDVGSEMAKSRIHGPAGLDVGAETPEEIALSVISEIMAVIGGRRGGFLRGLRGAIHNRGSQYAFSTIRMSQS
jgi:xanthine/CO dehydrogenase XdhC/CoxF family maturation factor